MFERITSIPDAGARDTVLLILLGVIAAFFLGTIVFSVYALALRRWNRGRDLRRTQLAERWKGPVLAAITEPDRTDGIVADVEEEYRLRFVGFVLDYARRVRGEERDVMSALARPFLGLIVRRADSKREEVRARAIQTLGTLGLPEHAPVVLRALDDPSPLVAMVSARALAREKTPEYAPAVLARLERFKGWDRRFLASMLAAMGPDVSGTLRWGLGDPTVDAWTRSVLAEASHIQGDFEAADIAARVVEETDDRQLRISAIRLLGSVGRPEHAPTVRSLCSSEDWVVRAQALRALGALGGPQDVDTLLRGMHDAEPWAALHAARAVAAAGGRARLSELAVSGDPRGALARQILAEAGVS